MDFRAWLIAQGKEIYMAALENPDPLTKVDFLVGYYNVLFCLMFRVGLDEYKKNILIDRINSGEKMMMKDIYRWCKSHQVPFWTKFIYRRDFSVTANIWNLYSYCRFKWEMAG